MLLDGALLPIDRIGPPFSCTSGRRASPMRCDLRWNVANMSETSWEVSSRSLKWVSGRWRPVSWRGRILSRNEKGVP